MFGIEVNPANVIKGDKLAVKHYTDSDGNINVTRSREIKKVSFCEGSPEKIHLDHECYDTRFATVIIAQK